MAMHKNEDMSLDRAVVAPYHRGLLITNFLAAAAASTSRYSMGLSVEASSENMTPRWSNYVHRI